MQETNGGSSHQKLGYADINLAEFAGTKHVSQCYLLDGYNSRSRQNNSLLKVTIDMTQRSGDSLFKVWEKFSDYYCLPTYTAKQLEFHFAKFFCVW